MNQQITLVSHPLCPYVQRAAIVLLEKWVPFNRVDIDLGNKPEWFLKSSPLGTVPIMTIGTDVIFESAAIIEYLDDTYTPAMHPTNSMLTAQHRAWMEFGSGILNAIAAFYSASQEKDFERYRLSILERLSKLEDVLCEGPYFSGAAFCLVDAVYAPVFRYFDVIEQYTSLRFTGKLVKIDQWRNRLRARDSVINAVSSDYAQRLTAFLINKDSVLSNLMLCKG